MTKSADNQWNAEGVSWGGVPLKVNVQNLEKVAYKRSLTLAENFMRLNPNALILNEIKIQVTSRGHATCQVTHTPISKPLATRSCKVLTRDE